jgi:ATP-dependent RNA helicase DDX27
VLVIGASSIQKQELALRNNPEVVIGTPGRIIDVLMNSRSVGIENLEVLVFDEADKLLELGFESEIKEIIKHCNEEVQTVMFSATIDKDINRLAHITTKKPIRLSADPDNVFSISLRKPRRNCISKSSNSKRILMSTEKPF